MIKRLYIHNYRCLENFELRLGNMSSVLLIGKNGAGKTTVGLALEVLQKIARGTNRVSDLVSHKDIARGQTTLPIRFEVEVELESETYTYTLALEFPTDFRELRVLEEKLTVGGTPIFTRSFAQVRLFNREREASANFGVDWHLVALPIIQHPIHKDPISIFRRWLGNMLILRPIPGLARGDSETETLQPDPRVTNFGEWFSGLLLSAPSAYSKISEYLKDLMVDFKEISNPQIGRESRSLFLRFSNSQGNIVLPFEELSDGEKCFMIFALTIASNEAYGPLLCFWDEPDNFLAPSEVGSSVMALRKAFRDKGQLILTSHNPEAIRRFSDENTLILFRNSHLEPTISRSIEDLRSKGDLTGDFVDALVRGDITP